MFISLVVRFVTLIIVTTLLENNQVSGLHHDGLIGKLLDLGKEDVNWKDYGEFGYTFAPTEALLEKAGFDYKLHYFTTEDGYLIELVHVINPLADPLKLKKYPVLLSHGFAQASYNFVSQSINDTKALKWPRKSNEIWHKSSDRNLAILLANNGFDVWLSTSRGSLSNTKPQLKLHTKYSPSDSKFWRFSLDEQAKYDIPCQVDGVLKLTGKKKLAFAGYSQSTFTMIGKLAIDPEFAKKIHTFLVVAPITTMEHDTGILRPVGRIVRLVPETFRDSPFFPIEFGRIVTKLSLAFYSRFPRLFKLIIASAFNSAFGNNGLKAFDGLKLIFRLFRFPTSFRGFLHFMQIQFEGRMSQFDHGLAGNLERFGTPQPPAYNTSNIDLDGIAIYVGDKDCLSMSVDNDIWVGSLKTPPIEYKVIPGWNHLDYILAEDNDILMNRPILRLLNDRMK